MSVPLAIATGFCFVSRSEHVAPSNRISS
jgi:hypothetical protein